MKMPPAPGRQVWGDEAISEARRLMRLANVYGLNPKHAAWLCAIARQERPLSYRNWLNITQWFAKQQELFERMGWPATAPGRRLYLEWKRKSPVQRGEKIRLRAGLPGLNTTT